MEEKDLAASRDDKSIGFLVQVMVLEARRFFVASMLFPFLFYEGNELRSVGTPRVYGCLDGARTS